MKKLLLFLGIVCLALCSCKKDSPVGVKNGIYISIIPMPTDFGRVSTAYPKNLEFIFGDSSLSAGKLTGSVSLPGDPYYTVVSGGTFSLNPGQYDSCIVKFAPLVAGHYPVNLTISHNGENSPAILPLVGDAYTESP